MRRRTRLLVTVATGCLLAGTVGASETRGPGSVSVGVKVGAETRDLLSIGDIRPTVRGNVLGDLSIGVALWRDWEAGVGARVGGSWFDFRAPLGASGNIKDQTWSSYLSVDKAIARSPAFSVSLGLLGEYGEARSWTDTRTYSQEGPRTFFGGGGARIGVLTPIGSRAHLQGEIGQSIFHGHARDPFTRSDFNWLGRALTLAVGVRVNLVQR
jgi:hypothetical protein